MADFTLHERVLEQKDWAVAVFLLVFALITVVKTNFENRFIHAHGCWKCMMSSKEFPF